MVALLFFLLRLLLSPVRPISRLEPRTRRTVPRAIIDLKARTGVRAIRIPGPFVSLRSNDVPQRLWKAPMPSSTLLAARVRALAMVLAVALAATPSHAGDDIRAGPTRTAKERLGGKASDEQRVDNCKVPPDLRGPHAGVGQDHRVLLPRAFRRRAGYELAAALGKIGVARAA